MILGNMVWMQYVEINSRVWHCPCPDKGLDRGFQTRRMVFCLHCQTASSRIGALLE